MSTNQPSWELVANLGDVNPVDYGGYFVLRDTTGVYAEEAELLVSLDSDDSGEKYRVYRFILERCTVTDGILSDNEFHPDHPAWFASPSSKGEKYTLLGDLASFSGIDAEELAGMFCSANPCERAHAYRIAGEYHGFENFDSYPLELTREEAEERYNRPQYANA